MSDNKTVEGLSDYLDRPRELCLLTPAELARFRREDILDFQIAAAQNRQLL